MLYIVPDVEEELTYGQLQQLLIDTVRETHFYCIESFERILKELRKKPGLTDDLEIFGSYNELIEQTENELTNVKNKTSTILATFDVMQKDLDSLK